MVPVTTLSNTIIDRYIDGTIRTTGTYIIKRFGKRLRGREPSPKTNSNNKRRWNLCTTYPKQNKTYNRRPFGPRLVS